MEPSVEIIEPVSQNAQISNSAAIPENEEKRVIGRPFQPGQSGNPGGRPKRKLISEAYKDILENEGAEAFAKVVARDALAADKARDRLAAVQEITDRVEGKAVQTVNQRGVFIVAAPSPEALATLDSWADEE